MYYFASDMHLGFGSREEAHTREKLFIRWLRKVSRDAEAIFIVGDMFDFWYEYKRVVPKGFSRLLGTLSELTDSGVEIHFFPGNHDMWAYSYLQEECGVEIHHTHKTFTLYDKQIYVAHGDDIYKNTSKGVRLLNGIFRSRALRWLFSHLVHPDAAMRFGHGWSSHSRKSKAIAHRFLEEQEPMVAFARQYLSARPMDYFIFGHNHCAEIYPLDDHAGAVFLGEWIENPTYATLGSDGKIALHKVSDLLK